MDLYFPLAATDKVSVSRVMIMLNILSYIVKNVQIITAIKLKIYQETVAAVATFRFVPNHNG